MYLFIQESTIAYYVTSNAVSGVVLMIITGCILASIALLGVIGPAISWKPLVIIVKQRYHALCYMLFVVHGCYDCIDCFRVNCWGLYSCFIFITCEYITLTITLPYLVLQKSNVEEHMLNSIDKYGESSQDSDFVDFFQSQVRRI